METQLNQTSALPSLASTVRRINTVDLLRGLVMVIMLLDHTREFVHGDALNFDPTDLTKTNALLFFTRWITHFCAPTFVFLAGTGAYLQLARGKSKAELAKFLVTRGLWLIAIELCVIRFITWFNFDLHFVFMLQVIWVIGVGMIFLAALVRFNLRTIAIIGGGMIALHNLLDLIPFKASQPTKFWEAIWMILHQPGVIFFSEKTHGLALYPLIPWIGVIAVGYVFGAVYQMEAEPRRKLLFRLGAMMLISFVILRAINIYGDPLRWSPQKNFVFTILSFLNVLKYPPSLLFLLLTLGVAILALAIFEKVNDGFIAKILITFGRVPLIFYIGQWITAHGLAVIAAYFAGQPLGWLFTGLLDRPQNPGNLGFNLGVVYLCWFVGLLILYPLCSWFAGVKKRRDDWWLSYL